MFTVCSFQTHAVADDRVRGACRSICSPHEPAARSVTSRLVVRRSSHTQQQTSFFGAKTNLQTGRDCKTGITLVQERELSRLRRGVRGCV
ncbi:hypothetical protein C0Q70_15096 [Pomacea canaliculata]|uniref:Uncharacterized protein n=1 Tax=Pomacea canaliculata TaxID=400727 RepID=A0A2T7NTX2_POMCA|nr:hypothetical protein C0Q70_15096 [Pomacea canaliculata]